jgi:16S rRNA (guanine527-N7)-methyltransferase
MVRDDPTPGAAPRTQARWNARRRAVNREREPLPSRVQDTPLLPAAYADALDAGLDALQLALPPDARAAIDGHVRLLLAWTRAINLTAVRDPGAAATLHVVDSLTAVAPLRARGIDRVLDLGSGGGVPGIPLAIALPASDALLVEPIGKKGRFLATAVEAAGLAGTTRVAVTRAETLAADPRHRGRWPAITARAVSTLAELVELAFPLLAEGGVLVAWKRGDLGAELAGGERAMVGLGGGRIEIVDPGLGSLPGHRLVLVTRTGVVPDGYPRDPGARKRHPW